MTAPDPPGPPDAPVPTEDPNVSRHYPDDATQALVRGQEAYESTRQGEIDPGTGAPRSDRAPQDLSGASSGLGSTDPAELTEPAPEDATDPS